MLGAWLGPAGERVSPDVGPTAAYFRYALKRTQAPKVSLTVHGAAPPKAVMAQFRGVSTDGTGTRVDLDHLEWQGSDDDVVCVGSVDSKPLKVRFVLTGRQWEETVRTTP